MPASRSCASWQGSGRTCATIWRAGIFALTRGADTLASAESLRNLLAWALFGRGPLTSNVGEAAAFVRTRPELAAPDLELLFAPVLFEEEGLKQPTEDGLTLGVVLLQPKSSGTVTLRSSNPLELPAIDPRYLTDPGGEDVRTLLQGLRLARRVLAQEPLAGYVDSELLPGAEARTDEALIAHLRATSQTLYHPVATCRMGTDPRTVVDPRLRVRGIEGLRIVDASVMPASAERPHELADGDDRGARGRAHGRRLSLGQPGCTRDGPRRSPTARSATAASANPTRSTEARPSTPP